MLNTPGDDRILCLLLPFASEEGRRKSEDEARCILVGRLRITSNLREDVRLLPYVNPSPTLRENHKGQFSVKG